MPKSLMARDIDAASELATGAGLALPADDEEDDDDDEAARRKRAERSKVRAAAVAERDDDGQAERLAAANMSKAVGVERDDGARRRGAWCMRTKGRVV
jgi:hypothetical protein